MNSPPFRISGAAAGYIRHMYHIGIQHGTAGLVPVLCRSMNETRMDQNDQVFERCTQEFFDIEWYSIEQSSSFGFAEYDIAGLAIQIPSDTIDSLEGKALVLKEVPVGYPIPSARTRPMLIASHSFGKSKMPGTD